MRGSSATAITSSLPICTVRLGLRAQYRCRMRRSFGATSFARSQMAPSMIDLLSSHCQAAACVAASLPSIQVCWRSSLTPSHLRLVVHASAEPSGTRSPVGFKW